MLAGAVLIFLPGYDDIVTLRELILAQENYSELGSIKLFVLHSSMQSSSDQKQVFKVPPKGTRKIVNTCILLHSFVNNMLGANCSVVHILLC